MLKVAFICVHNSCRSQMAEALGRKYAAEVFESYSAGTMTKPQINQDAVRIIKELYGIDMEKDQYPKLIDELPEIDVVITMGCNVQCPSLPCRYREDWGLDDPSGKSDQEFVSVAEEIEEKVRNLAERIKNLEGESQETFINGNIPYKEEKTISTMKEKLHTGELYLPGDDEIVEVQTKRLDRLYDYNMTRPTEGEKRTEMLKEMFAEIGEGCYIEPPLHANMGGAYVHFGKNVYANFNLTLVDDTHIYVGDYTMFGPNVTVATAGHPILPELREKLYQYNMSVHIGRNCWIGAGALIMPGVTIGDNTVIGAGSVVTKDIPANVVAVGNPCRVLREIGEHDREYYFKDRKIDHDII